MKIVTLVAFLALFSCGSCIAQENIGKTNPVLSSEIYFLYPYPPLDFNKFNYGIGGEVSEKFKPFKVSTGIFFYTGNSNIKYDAASPFDKRISGLNYFNIPILIKIKLFKLNSLDNNLFLNTGLLFNIPRNYSYILYYKNNTIPPYEEIPVKYRSGNSLRLGLEYNKQLNDRLNFIADIFCDYKFSKDYIEIAISNPPPPGQIPGSGSKSVAGAILFWGVFCGIEWNYNHHVPRTKEF
ncbi:MAG: hypothetical protein HY064_00035 [Bacteroidetes bacterium]|nr:hypothetical protein [Bacteroidota bacterium]